MKHLSDNVLLQKFQREHPPEATTTTKITA